MNKTIVYISGAIPPVKTGSGLRALHQAEYLSKLYDTVLLTKTSNKIESDVKIKRITNLNIDKRNKIFNIYNFLMSIIFLPYNLLEIYLTLRRRNIISIHLFGIGMISIKILILVHLKILRPKKILFDVTSDRLNGPKYVKKKLKKLYFIFKRNIDTIVTHSDYSYDTWLGEDTFFVTRINQPINLDRFKVVSNQKKLELKNIYGLSEKFVINYTGVMKKDKGIEDLILIANKIAKKISTTRFLFLMVGHFNNRKYEEKIKMRIVTEGLNNNFEFIGFTNETPKYYQMSDVFIFLSKSEGMAKTPMEAQSCGLPLIIKEIKGMTNYMISGDNGVIIINKKQAAEAIYSYYKNTDKRLNASLKARKWAEENYNHEKVMIDLIKLYESEK